MCSACVRRCNHGPNCCTSMWWTITGFLSRGTCSLNGQSRRRGEARKNDSCKVVLQKKAPKDVTTAGFSLGAWSISTRGELAVWMVTEWTRNKASNGTSCPRHVLLHHGSPASSGMGRSSWRVSPLPRHLPLWYDGFSFSYQPFGTIAFFCLLYPSLHTKPLLIRGQARARKSFALPEAWKPWVVRPCPFLDAFW